jgi:hypothetical protein
MGRSMSTEELQDYMTVAQKNKVFVEEYVPKGYYHKVTKNFITLDGKSYIECETTIRRRIDKEDLFICNASALECITTNGNKTVESLRFCETSSRGRAFSALGIGLDAGMSSRDDLDCGVDYSGPEAVTTVSAPKVKNPSIEENLKRMKIDYATTDNTFVVPVDGVKGKTLQVLKRYGFKVIDDNLVCRKDDA